MATKLKTWTQLMGEVEETARKWGDVAINGVENDLDARGRRRTYQSPEEREVRLRMAWYNPAERRRVELKADVRAAPRLPRTYT